MKRRNDSTALNTDEAQPGDANACTPENAATDHAAQHPGETEDILQAIPLEASLAPALPEYARLTPEQVAIANQTGQWLDAFVAFASAASPLTPPAFHLAAGIFLGGVAIARRLYLDLNSSAKIIYPNLYLLNVGPSTVQRTSTALHVVKGLVEAAGMQHFLQTAQQTPAALTLDWSTRVPSTYTNWQPTLQAKWLQERVIAAQRGWLLDNAARLLDSYNDDYTAGLLPLVWDLYGCPDEALTRNPLIYQEATVKQPYLNIFGVTTDSLMARHLKKHRWAKSFLKCFVLVGSANVDTWHFWPGPQVYPADLVQGLQRVATQLLPLPEASLNVVETTADAQAKPRQTQAAQLSAPLMAYPVQLARGGEAWAAWERYARATGFDLLRRDKLADICATSYGRLSTQLIKVAIILATFDAPQLPVIVEPCHIYRAQQIVELWRTSLHNVIEKLRHLRADNAITEEIRGLRGGWARDGPLG
jgi:hypothetical protein